MRNENHPVKSLRSHGAGNTNVKTAPEDTYVRSYKLTLQITQLLRTVPRDSATRVMNDQRIRSITGIGANLLEAKSASSKHNYINFFTPALKSANESKFWLGLLHNSIQCSSKRQSKKYLGEISEIAR